MGKYNFDLNYTFTDTFDANTCSEEHKNAYSDNECRLTGNSVATAKVRVPRHAVSAKIGYQFNPNFNTVLRGVIQEKQETSEIQMTLDRSNTDRLFGFRFRWKL